VVRRARDYLARLDKFNATGGAQRDLFAPIGVTAQDEPEVSAALPGADAVAAQLAALDPDAMTPRDALAALYALRKQLGR
jgi:DNA mismatch repair protein MutS